MKQSPPMNSRAQPQHREDCRHFGTLGTRWHGQLVHVYVNRATRRPTALPLALSQALQGLL